MDVLDPEGLLQKYYPTHTFAYSILWQHSTAVAMKAATIARALASTETIDCEFVEQASMLHDIGICFVHAPGIGCYGEHPYIMHGVCGAKLLRKEGLDRHAYICENHIGVGLEVEDIENQHLPLPRRAMVPNEIEAKIVAYSDLFYSKNPNTLTQEKTPLQVRKSLEKFGVKKVEIFDSWHARFAL
ncbi:MAG: HDIG domain-containing protein [Desulfuromonadaceae bacterium]|nr:HDIG domain-containing protein [Desulfuromonadaceae bacterium]